MGHKNIYYLDVKSETSQVIIDLPKELIGKDFRIEIHPVDLDSQSDNLNHKDLSLPGPGVSDEELLEHLLLTVDEPSVPYSKIKSSWKRRRAQLMKNAE